MSASPENRNRWLSILIVLAFPAVLIGHLFLSRYGGDLSLLLADIRFSAQSALRALTAVFGPLSDTALTVLRWSAWLLAPILTGLLVRRVKLALTPLDRAGSGLSGVVAAVSLLLLTRDMPVTAVPLMMLICVMALISGGLSRSYTRFPVFGVLGILLILVLNLFALHV